MQISKRTLVTTQSIHTILISTYFIYHYNVHLHKLFILIYHFYHYLTYPTICLILIQYFCIRYHYHGEVHPIFSMFAFYCHLLIRRLTFGCNNIFIVAHLSSENRTNWVLQRRMRNTLHMYLTYCH